MAVTCCLLLDTSQSAGRGCENRCKALTILIRTLKAVTCIDVLRHALRSIFWTRSFASIPALCQESWCQTRCGAGCSSLCKAPLNRRLGDERRQGVPLGNLCGVPQRPH